MNFLSIIAIAGISITVFVLALLLSKGKKRLTDLILAGWLAALGANQLFFLVSSLDGVDLPFWAALMGMGMVLVHSPLMFLFVKHAFRRRMPLWEMLHFLPFVAFVAVFGTYRMFHPEAIFVQDGFLMFADGLPELLGHYGLFFALVAGAYTFLSLFWIRKKRMEIDGVYSNQTREVLQWLQKWIIAAVLFFLATYFFIEFALSARGVDTSRIFPFVSGFVTVYIFYIGFMGIRFSRVFQEEIPDLEVPGPADPQNDAQLKAIADQIISVMEARKLYLNPDLTLTDLARECGQTPTKTSIAINKTIGMNFYTFVNGYRAREFIHRMDMPENKHLSLLGLAFECGFRSKSTFNAFFKSHTGKTPSQFGKGRGDG